MAVASFKKPPTAIKTMLEHQSIVPSQIEEIKLSAAHAGALNTLSRAKPWQSELDPTEMASRCPEFNDDGSLLTEEDFAKYAREMRPLAY